MPGLIRGEVSVCEGVCVCSCVCLWMYRCDLFPQGLKAGIYCKPSQDLTVIVKVKVFAAGPSLSICTLKGPAKKQSQSPGKLGGAKLVAEGSLLVELSLNLTFSS